MSFPNQKIVKIVKPKYKENFLQIGIDEWQQARKIMNYGEFALYLYLAGNANGFNLELSQQAFENATGYKKSTYNSAVARLQELGYLIHKTGNIYQFYTSPRRQSGRAQFDETSNDLFNGEKSSPQQSLETAGTNKTDRSTNIEINKIYKIDKINRSGKKKEKPSISLSDALDMEDEEEAIGESRKSSTEKEELIMKVR